MKIYNPPPGGVYPPKPPPTPPPPTTKVTKLKAKLQEVLGEVQLVTSQHYNSGHPGTCMKQGFDNGYERAIEDVLQFLNGEDPGMALWWNPLTDEGNVRIEQLVNNQSNGN